MAPFIRDGDAVTVAPRSGRRTRRGDVVALVVPDDGRLLVHRVVGRRGAAVLIKGDSVSRSDGWFGEAEVVGVVVRVDRGNKRRWLGLGPERALVGVLSRTRLPVWRLLARLRRVILRPAKRPADE